MKARIIMHACWIGVAVLVVLFAYSLHRAAFINEGAVHVLMFNGAVTIVRDVANPPTILFMRSLNLTDGIVLSSPDHTRPGENGRRRAKSLETAIP